MAPANALPERLAETLSVFERSAQITPLTTSEVAEATDCSRRAAYNRLDELVDRDALATKKVGARGRVWWRTADGMGGARTKDEADTGSDDSGGDGPATVDAGADEPTTGIGHDEDLEFRSLVQAVDEYAIFMLDAEGRVVTWNDGARFIKGYRREEILGDHYARFYTEEAAAEGLPERNLEEAAAKGSVDLTGWRVRADGTRFWANATLTAVRDDDDTLQGYVKVTRDMTDHREYETRLRRQRNLVQRVLETSTAGSVLVDADGGVVERNERATELLGVDPVDVPPDEWPLVDERGDPVPCDEQPTDRVFETGSPVSDWEAKVAGTDDDRWVSVTATPLDRETGTVERAVVTLYDVTPLKSRERRLERHRADLQRELDEVFERIDSAVFALDDDWRVTYVNTQAERLLERSADDLVGGSIWERFPEAVGTTFQSEFERAMETQETVSFEEYYPPLDAWFEVWAYPSETGLSVHFRDVSERKEREVELERYETIVETIDDGVYVLDEEYHFVEVNDAYAEMTGYDRDELLGAHCSLVVGESISAEAAAYSEAMAAGDDDHATIEAEIERADGDSLAAESKFTPLPSDDGEFRGTVGVVRDVSERKEREAELERYETVVETIDDGVYVLDGDDRFVLVNDALCDLVGYDRSALLGEPASIVHSEVVNEKARKRAGQVDAGEADYVAFELDLRRADGETVPVESHFGPYPTPAGQPPGRAGVVRDVTERKRRERELERYETIVETVDDGIYAVDADARFVMVNDAFCELTGYDREELLGARAATVHDDEVTPQAAELAAAIDEGGRDAATIDLDVHRADGTSVPAESRLAPLQLDDGRGRCGVVRDISERIERERELERRVRQQEVVTELGQRALGGGDLDALMAAAVERVADTLDTEYCKVLDLDPEAEELLLRQGVGWNGGLVGSATVSAVDDESQAAYTLRTDEPVVVTDLADESRFSGPDLLTDHGVRSGISTIIGPVDDPWGILGTHDRAMAEFAEHDVNFVRAVANILATAIERHRNERRVRHQRERLAALNQLNGVVREITEAVVDQSTREEIERVVCEGLAGSESYLYAWIGEIDSQSQTVQVRTEAGVEGYIDDITISTDPDNPLSRGATGRAVVTREMQVTHDVLDDPDYGPWRDHVREYGFRSSTAIPITHEGTLYGLLNIYADRPNAFQGEERAVVGQIGEVMGHAIASIERKRALMSDEVLRIDYRIRNLFDVFDAPTTEGTIAFDRAVPVGGDEYLVYGSAPGEAFETVRGLVDEVPTWNAVTVLSDEAGSTRFELRMTEPPVLSAVASRGGYIEQAAIEDGDYRMEVHLPPGVEARQISDVVREAYPNAEFVSQRHLTTAGEAHSLKRVLAEDLTDRQRTALEAAYFSGFFEWPRESDGGDVADSLGVSPPTFHQHLRLAQQKLLAATFDDGR
ncbi:PAS domain S-box protein [Salinigranum sp. GCM10025319]|uniref:PAS domain S-box protein n=1 Tax=Salinigranum sp. GCM10025319 TaxID=3252687 RepID=UPI0036165737